VRSSQRKASWIGSSADLNGSAEGKVLAKWNSERCSLGSSATSGTESRKARNGATERQGMSEFEAVGQALPAKAQRVGGRSESSTSRRSFEKEAIAAKNRVINAREPGRETQARRGKPAGYGDATKRGSVEWRRTSAE
jgi:hypothetical protein